MLLTVSACLSTPHTLPHIPSFFLPSLVLHNPFHCSSFPNGTAEKARIHVQSANVGQRVSNSNAWAHSSICVFLTLLWGTSGAEEVLASMQGPEPRGSKVGDQVGQFSQISNDFYSFHFDFRTLSIVSLLPPSLTVPFCQFLPYQTLQNFSLQAVFLCFVLAIHVLSSHWFTAIICLPGTFHFLKTISILHHVLFPFSLCLLHAHPFSHLL